MFTTGTVWKTLSNNYGKRFPPLLRVFPVTPTVVNNSVGNGFYDAFPGNSSTQNELKSKKTSILLQAFGLKISTMQGFTKHKNLCCFQAKARLGKFVFRLKLLVKKLSSALLAQFFKKLAYITFWKSRLFNTKS